MEASRTAEKLGTVMGDSTEIRGLKSRAMNNVHVLMSDGGQLLHLGVNSDWPHVEAENLMSDNEPGLVNAVKAKRRQLGILHALKYIHYTLWGERMSKDDRIDVDRAVKHILFPPHQLDREAQKVTLFLDRTERFLKQKIKKYALIYS